MSKHVDLPRSFPEVCLLSNGNYSVMLTTSGGGYSALKGMDVTRWREDVTCDCWGQYCYIRNLDDGRVWSVGRQPLGRDASHYEAILRPDRATIRQPTARWRHVTRWRSRPMSMRKFAALP